MSERGNTALLDRQKRELAEALHEAWGKYEDTFGCPPHGTLKQMGALVALARLETFIGEIENRAVLRWSGEGGDTPAPPPTPEPTA